MRNVQKAEAVNLHNRRKCTKKLKVDTLPAIIPCMTGEYVLNLFTNKPTMTPIPTDARLFRPARPSNKQTRHNLQKNNTLQKQLKHFHTYIQLAAFYSFFIWFSIVKPIHENILVQIVDVVVSNRKHFSSLNSIQTGMGDRYHYLFLSRSSKHDSLCRTHINSKRTIGNVTTENQVLVCSIC